ncbi:MAG: response regulator transcription factor [Rhodospirillales bacterium]|nr:response regulator transcription factor [Rhodospirillales bacterium]MBO6787302.1 response regulator transcription factor [Rhodospirillales bacterium]
MPEQPIVYLVDDDENFRRAVVWLLNSVGHKVRVFDSAEGFLEIFDPSFYGCLITDMRMQQKSGLDILAAIGTDCERFPVIVMTAFGTVRSGVRAMKMGAFDFIEKPFDDQHLLDLVNRALETAQKGRDSNLRRLSLLKGIDSLSGREKEVLSAIMAGQTNEEIANRLNIGAKTVETYRSRILMKVGYQRTSDLRAHMERHRIFPAMNDTGAV